MRFGTEHGFRLHCARSSCTMVHGRRLLPQNAVGFYLSDAKFREIGIAEMWICCGSATRHQFLNALHYVNPPPAEFCDRRALSGFEPKRSCMRTYPERKSVSQTAASYSGDAGWPAMGADQPVRK